MTGGADAPSEPLLINLWRLTDMDGNAGQPAGEDLYPATLPWHYQCDADLSGE